MCAAVAHTAQPCHAHPRGTWSQEATCWAVQAVQSLPDPPSSMVSLPAAAGLGVAPGLPGAACCCASTMTAARANTRHAAGPHKQQDKGQAHNPRLHVSDDTVTVTVTEATFRVVRVLPSDEARVGVPPVMVQLCLCPDMNPHTCTTPTPAQTI